MYCIYYKKNGRAEALRRDFLSAPSVLFGELFHRSIAAGAIALLPLRKVVERGVHDEKNDRDTGRHNEAIWFGQKQKRADTQQNAQTDTDKEPFSDAHLSLLGLGFHPIQHGFIIAPILPYVNMSVTQ